MSDILDWKIRKTLRRSNELKKTFQLQEDKRRCDIVRRRSGIKSQEASNIKHLEKPLICLLHWR